MPISIVAFTSSFAGLGGIGALTGLINTTSANYIYVNIADYQVGGPPGVLADNKGNVWSLIRNDNDAVSTRCLTYFSVNPNVGSGHQFSYNLGSATPLYPSMTVIALSSVYSLIPLDQQGGYSTSSNVSSASVSLTPLYNNEIVICGVNGGGNANPAPSISSGLTLLTSNSALINQRVAASVGYTIQTAATVSTAVWNFPTATRTSMSMITLRASENSSNFFLFM